MKNYLQISSDQRALAAGPSAQQHPAGAQKLRGNFGYWYTCALAALWCVFLLGSYAFGSIDYYLSEDFVLFTLIAGLLLFVFVAHALVLGPRAFESAHQGSFIELIAAGKVTARSLIASIVLVVPLLAAWIASPQQLSIGALNNRGLGQGGSELGASMELNEKVLQQQFPKDAQGDRPMSLLHLSGAASQQSYRELLTGEQVVLRSQLAPWPEGLPGGEQSQLLYQLMVACCAADAQPLSAQVVYLEEEEQLLAGKEDGQWVELRGAIDFLFDEEHEYWRVLIRHRESKEVEMPLNPFIQR